MQNIDVMLNEKFIQVLEGVFILLVCALTLNIWLGYYRYKFLLALKKNGSWRAFVPVMSQICWWEVGKVSLHWLWLIVLPSILGVVLPWGIASWSVPLIFLVWFILRFIAGMNLAKDKSISKIWGYLIALPFVNIWAYPRFLAQTNSGSLPFSLWKGIIAGIISFILSLIIWGGILYLSFRESII